MLFFEWNEKYATNIPEIDKHHQHLFALINALHDDVLACQTLEEEQSLTKKLLAELEDYVGYHFSTEERLMQECGFLGQEEHLRAHNYYRGRLSEMIETFVTSPAAMSFDTFIFLRDWIAEHVLVKDAEYISCVNK